MRQFTNESAFSRWFCDEVLSTCGARVFAVVASTMQEPGWPDRFFSHRIIDLWMEVKKDERSLTTKQRLVIVDLLKRETCACEVRLDSHRGTVTFRIPVTGGYRDLTDCTLEWLEKTPKAGLELMTTLREAFENLVFGSENCEYFRKEKLRKWFDVV